MAAEEEAKLDSLREYELRLLRCSIPSSSPTSFEPPDDSDTAKHGRSLYALIEDVVSSIETGDYVRALSFDAA
ncbi:hypothetical protein Acr_00g0058680 [Actinidia rufa]|uniref:Uncharacterized protein n=1 Tax=Actinidia rufa TaxID=165716 RepID=A0A7J0DNH8_9ERIC|nr:hypothetical protein Acr_00g0058680 [Actinidia rufa]